MGHAHFWTTPEEVGERQPLVESSLGLVLALDGRIDNREELIGELGEAPRWRDQSDAQLLLAAYENWREEFVERLIGPFALALYDKRKHRVLLARDPLGVRTLYWSLTRDRLAVASEESSVLFFPGVSDEVDPQTMARFFAVEGPVPGRTFFRDVNELVAGELLVVGQSALSKHRYWRPKSKPSLHLQRQEEYEEQYRGLLERAVVSRLRTNQPPGIMMSGGLDSTSVAAVAARDLRRGASEQLQTFSWVFDELAEADERPFMDLVIGRWNLNAKRVCGDDAWPLSGANGDVVNPNGPYRAPYRELRDRLFDLAAANGVRVLLTGECADDLYTGADRWLADLLAEGRVFQSIAEVTNGFAERFLRHHRSISGLRPAIAEILGYRMAVSEPTGAPWLTPDAEAAYLSSLEARGQGALLPARARQHQNVFSARSEMAMRAEVFDSVRRRVELRSPYQDLRLVEFLLDVPAHQLFRPGWHKWLPRKAMTGLLPDQIRKRRTPGSLIPLYERGVLERERTRLRNVLGDRGKLWRDYVRVEWLQNELEHHDASPRGGREALALWYAFSAEFWYRLRFGGESGPSRTERIFSEEVSA